jgi:hypothetical protein
VTIRSTPCFGTFLTDLSGSVHCRCFGQATIVEIPRSIPIVRQLSFAKPPDLEIAEFKKGSESESIEEKAFFDSSRLESIVVSSIGASCFHACSSLKSIVFAPGSSFERIENSAFDGAKFESVILPSSRRPRQGLFQRWSRVETSHTYGTQGVRLALIALPASV